MKKAIFELDALSDQSFEGFDTGESWNGWAVPLFTFEQAQKLVAAWRRAGWKASYNESKDAFVFGFTGDDGEELEEFSGFERDGAKFYAVGSRAWTWDATVETSI